MTSKAICVCLLLMIACGGGEDRRPASLDDVLNSCDDWTVVVETAFGDCLGWDQAMLDEQIALGKQSCYNELNALAEGCWDQVRDKLDLCAENDAAKTCDELCPSGTCISGCFYSCPD